LHLARRLRCTRALSKFEIEGLIDEAGQSRLFAGKRRRPRRGEKFVQAARDQCDGTLAGFYSRSVRGIVARALPVPITRGPHGAAAGDQFAGPLPGRPGEGSLLGTRTGISRWWATPRFAVVRSSILKPSRERAPKVARFMRDNRLNVQTDVIGEGADDPMLLPDAFGLSQEDIYAINCRVEWRRE
jgi:hypothetical protein